MKCPSILHFLLFNSSNRRVRSSKSMSPPSGGPPTAGPGGGPVGGKPDLGTGGRSKLSEGGGRGGMFTPDWGAVGYRNEQRMCYH